LVVASCGGGSDSAADTTTSQANPASTTTTTTPSTSTVAASATSAPATSSTAAPTKTILQLITDDGEFTVLLNLLQAARMTDTLSAAGPITFIAPTDKAFAKMSVATLDKFALNQTAMKQILDYHLVNSFLSTTDVAKGTVDSAEGQPLLLQPTKGLPIVNGIAVIKGARATNGLVLVVDTPLIPVDFELP
jgi:uncharacterized surface protein with fasciclin (FAS1) repeats